MEHKKHDNVDVRSKPVAEANLGAGELEALSKVYDDYFELIKTMNTETHHFVAKRLEHDMRLLHEFAHCQNPTDLYKLQMDFCWHMAEDYLAEVQKMCSLAANGVKFPRSPSDTAHVHGRQGAKTH